MSESPFGHQPSPVPTADIRSQAIARLKRAASLPRTPDGRRHAPQVTAGGPSAVSMSEDGHGGSTSYVTERSMTPSPTRGAVDHFGDEEMLAASPAGSKTAGGGGASMQRSASDSSRFKANTPPHLAYASANASPFFTAQPSPASSGGGADWGGGYPLTPSYMPSISPVPTPPSSFPASLQTPRAGRNTPSPLPTLGELRNLSRSNSAAARQNAMNKLIGGGASTPTPGGEVATPVSSSEEDLTLSLPGSARSLHRAGTIGVPRMFGMPAETAVDDSTLTPIPDTAFDVPRSRLQRSFTVSSSNMGEERRSAVGRRMVERLAERRAARQQEEQEVRTLWEERRRTRGSQKGISLATPENTPPRPLAAPATAPSAAPSLAPPPNPPSKLALPGLTALGAGAGAAGAAALLASQAVDRTPSRNTERSDDVFEYESHLNRSMSARTARTEWTERTDVFDSSPAPQAMPLYQHEFLGAHGEDDPTPLPIPELPFTSPIRHVPTESISSSGTVLGKAPDLARLSPTPANKERTASTASGDRFDVADYPSSAYSGSYPGSYHEIKPNGTSSWDPHGRVSPHDAYNLAPDPTRRHNGYPEGDGPEYTEVYDDSRPDSNASGVSQASNYNVTSEYTRHSKNSSISKMGRAVLTAMKSRSSGASTPPRSPALPNGTATSRRPSEASNSNSHSQQSHSSQRGVSPVQEPRVARQTATAPRAKPSPYKMEEHASSANTLLIQHQLSAAPSPLHFLPRANPSDPRIHNSKLSPFPGIASLEQQQRNRSQTNGSPQLRQNRSDTSVSTAALSPQIDMGRKSGDSERRRPGVHMVKHSRSSHGSGSGLGSRSESSHSHTHSQSHSQSHSQGHSQGHSHTYSEDHRNGERSSESLRRDAPAPRATPSPEVVHRVVGSNLKQRPDIPSFMMNRRKAPPPPPLDVPESNVVSINDDPTTPPAKSSSDMPARSRNVLGRMDNMFALSNNDPSRPDFLDDPPRKLLLAQQVLQVVNVQTVKDRYLFLFNDILVIAKPVLSSNTAAANLDMKFIVKSIVGLEKLIVSGISDEPTTEPPRHPAVKQFIQHFAEDSSGAVNELVERSNPMLDTPTLAGVLFATPELDKSQLGNLLSVDPHLLLAFVDKFNFAGVRIDDAMRVFLLSIRLPTDISAAQVVMRGFAEGYYRANEREIEYDDAAAEDLVFAALELNDMLYSTFGFAFPNHAVSHDTFVGAFRRMDPRRMVPDELLDEIYASIRSNKLAQALSPHEAYQARDALFTPARLPTRLRYQEWSDVFKVSITEADPAFKIELVSSGLEFDPPVLDFSRAPEASFRVRGRALGSQTMLLKRLGANAPLYPGLGTSRVFQVERSFMRNAFHVSFATPSGAKRRYCFSVPDAAARQRWGSMLSRQVWLTTEKKQGAGAPTTTKGRVRAAADAVALQVLRDTLIPRDASEGSDGQASANDISARMLKHGSVSVAYAQAKGSGAEADLGPLQPTRGHAHTDSTGSMVELQTGKELVLLCRQNSLLPAVLELLQNGNGNGDANATAKSHNAQPPAQPQNAKSQAQVAVRAAHLGNGQQPLRSAGLKAMMHDRRL